jgi:Family of unknown function (DUF6220)
MRKAFAGLAGLLMLVVVVQFFLAASGAFDSAPTEEAFQPHRTLGYIAIALAAVSTLVAAVVRMPGRLIGLSGLVVGLGIMQPVIAVIARAFNDGDTTTTAGQLVFGLHAINGLAIMGVLGSILILARQPASTEQTARAAGPAVG